MVSGEFQSPNAIPPRRSSTGLGSGYINPAQPVLKPVPGSSWISQEQPQKASAPQTSTPPASSHSQDPNTPDSEDSVAKHVQGTQWSMDKERIVLGPFDYMYDHPGKDIRKQFIAAFNAWLRVPEESLIIITKVVGMLHTASLLVDDVEDSSILRRGIPVAHNIFGTAQTINSANYVYFTALQELMKLRNLKAIEVYTDELCNLHRGQGMDLFWRDTLTCPSEDDYLEMVGNKTGGLFRLAVKLMQAESKNEKNYVPLVNVIGLLFQIRDDYMNLSSTEYTENKGLCEDLTEGKFSFPIIHSIRSVPQNRQLINILKQKTTDDEVKKYAVKHMERTGSFEYCRKVMADLNERALSLIEALDEGMGQGAGIKKILDKMVVVV